MARRNDKALIEKALQKRKNQEFAKRNLSEWYRKFVRYHNPWMRQLLDTFMRTGDLGINPLLIADRYKDVVVRYAKVEERADDGFFKAELVHVNEDGMEEV